LIAAGTAFAATFVAEFGDKSQLLAAGLAARLGRVVVLLGVTLGIVAVQAVAVTLGQVAGTFLPERAVAVASAVMFVVVAVWLWVDARARHPEGSDDSADTVPPAGRAGVVAVLAIAAAFAVGELGDKTQLATVALAARQDWSATLVGGVLGMVAANAIAIEAGARLGQVVDRRRVQQVSAVAFAVAGVVLAAFALAG
jgi:putative Ca2+/H+ antiporter (TMEM165/GDT1 family)